MKAFFVLTVAAAAVTFAAATVDPFLGEWKADPAKTRLSAGSDESKKREILKFEAVGTDQYRVTRTAPNSPSDTIGLMLDGMEHSGGAGSSALGQRLDARHFRNTIKGPKGTLVSDWQVSPDGKVLTNTRKGNGTATGRPIDEVLVYIHKETPPASR